MADCIRSTNSVFVPGMMCDRPLWRHQIEPLVGAGYRVLVPNQRGYGSSSAPSDVAAYRSDHLSADLVALLDDVGADATVYVYPGAGHAFANPSGRNYEEAAAETSWQRTVKFFNQTLKE